MKLKHRVVVIHQLSGFGEVRELREQVGPWVSPELAEVDSDRAAQDIGDDPTRYVLIEANKPEELTACHWSPT